MKTLRGFLDEFDLENKDKFLMSTEILALSLNDEVQNNYRKTDNKYLSIILEKKNDSEYGLPMEFLKQNESLDSCALRVLKEMGIKDKFYTQLHTYGRYNKSIVNRIVSNSYICLVNREDVKLSNNLEWFNISYVIDNGIISIKLFNNDNVINFKLKETLVNKLTDSYDYSIYKNDCLVLDTPIILWYGILYMMEKCRTSDIVFYLMPSLFSLGELQQAFEVVLNKKLLDPVFRRMISNKVIKTSEVKKGAGHRPSALYKYRD